MKSQAQFLKVKKELIFEFGNLWRAARYLGISYHRLLNVLSGRTEMPEEVNKKLLPFLNGERKVGKRGGSA